MRTKRSMFKELRFYDLTIIAQQNVSVTDIQALLTAGMSMDNH